MRGIWGIASHNLERKPSPPWPRFLEISPSIFPSKWPLLMKISTWRFSSSTCFQGLISHSEIQKTPRKYTRLILARYLILSFFQKSDWWRFLIEGSSILYIYFIYYIGSFSINLHQSLFWNLEKFKKALALKDWLQSIGNRFRRLSISFIPP